MKRSEITEELADHYCLVGISIRKERESIKELASSPGERRYLEWMAEAIDHLRALTRLHYSMSAWQSDQEDEFDTYNEHSAE